VGVAHQSGFDPLFDVATATAYFHRIGGDFARISASAELDERGQDAHQALRFGIPGVRLPQRLGRLKHHRAGLLGRYQQLEQLPPHQWQVDEPGPEGLAIASNVERLTHSAAHQSRGPHAVGQARVVHHVGHLHETTPWLAHQPRLGVVEADFTARHGARAQLVLESHDSVVVVAAVIQAPWQQEQCNPFEAGRSICHSRQHHGQGRIGIRAEPLVTAEQPHSRLRRIGAGNGRGRCNVGASPLLRHEHRPLGQRVQIQAGQGREEARHQLGCSELSQGSCQ
jgi:hypothetical protein